MEENFCPSAFVNFHNSDLQNVKYSCSPSKKANGILELEGFGSDSLFGSAPTSQKSSPTSLSPITRASLEDEERSSLFSSSDNGDKQDFVQNDSSLKCSKTLRFLIEAEEEMSSIWNSKIKAKSVAPTVLVSSENPG
jgi:hypothetical protein